VENNDLPSKAPEISPFLLLCAALGCLLGNLALGFDGFFFLFFVLTMLCLAERTQPFANSSANLWQSPHTEDNQDDNQDETNLLRSDAKWHNFLQPRK